MRVRPLQCKSRCRQLRGLNISSSSARYPPKSDRRKLRGGASTHFISLAVTSTFVLQTSRRLNACGPLRNIFFEVPCPIFLISCVPFLILLGPLHETLILSLAIASASRH